MVYSWRMARQTYLAPDVLVVGAGVVGSSAAWHLARRGLPVPADCVARDWSQPVGHRAALVAVFRTIYDDPATWWDAYDMCEKLVDVEEAFQLWRFRHLKAVERIIGHRPGTGGSSGAAFLKRALDTSFFPELIDVRGEIGTR